MKKIIFVFFMLAFSQLSACSECVKLLCKAMQAYESQVYSGKGKKENYDIGVINAYRSAIKYVNEIHPGAQLTLEEYEMILGKNEKE